MRKGKTIKLSEEEKKLALSSEFVREQRRRKLIDYIPKSASAYLVREIELLKMENEDLKRKIEELQEV